MTKTGAREVERNRKLIERINLNVEGALAL
jgi:hypothetical protein